MLFYNKCSKCNNDIEKNDKFCPFCGEEQQCITKKIEKKSIFRDIFDRSVNSCDFHNQTGTESHIFNDDSISIDINIDFD